MVLAACESSSESSPAEVARFVEGGVNMGTGGKSFLERLLGSEGDAYIDASGPLISSSSSSRLEPLESEPSSLLFSFGGLAAFSVALCILLMYSSKVKSEAEVIFSCALLAASRSIDDLLEPLDELRVALPLVDRRRLVQAVDLALHPEGLAEDHLSSRSVRMLKQKMLLAHCGIAQSRQRDADQILRHVLR